MAVVRVFKPDMVIWLNRYHNVYPKISNFISTILDHNGTNSNNVMIIIKIMSLVTFLVY